MSKLGGIAPQASVNPASTEALSSAGGTDDASPVTSRAAVQLGCIILGYVGVYLCRKNFAVAVPALQDAFHTNKATVGAIDSYATIAYMFGKLFWGPLVVDRLGGKICFFLILLSVAVFGGLSAFAISLPMLGMLYMANRFFGAGGWESMVKMVPDWFPTHHLPLAMGFLSLSFVFGGVCAVMLAGEIAALSNNNWRAIMGVPSLFLLVIIGICWLVLRKEKKPAVLPNAKPSEWRFSRILELFQIPQFWMVCGLSFILTITRETFNVWTVDFLKTDGGHMSSRFAALLSTPFDAMGAVGILLLGWVLEHLSPARRNWLLFGIMTTVAMLIYILPTLVHIQLWVAVVAIGLIGLLSYGPYSLLAGALSVEIKGKEYVATVAGLVDAAGYLSGLVSGQFFGWLLDHGGYMLGFHSLGLTTLISAVLCLGLYRKKQAALTPS